MSLHYMDSKTDNLAVTEEANVDESIPIYLKNEQSTEAYKETIIKDIESIDTYETRTKVNTTKWRKIYEVIKEDCFTESDISPDDLKKCKDNANESINISIEVKNNIK